VPAPQEGGLSKPAYQPPCPPRRNCFSQPCSDATTGRPHARPPSRVPQGGSKRQARRRALGWRDTETGRAGRSAGGEEPQAVQVVPAQGDQLDRQCEGEERGGGRELLCIPIKRTEVPTAEDQSDANARIFNYFLLAHILYSVCAIIAGIQRYRRVSCHHKQSWRPVRHTVKHAPERSTAVPVRVRVTSFIPILPAPVQQPGSAFCTLRLPLDISRPFSAARLHAARHFTVQSHYPDTTARPVIPIFRQRTPKQQSDQQRHEPAPYCDGKNQSSEIPC
jgi:hypothetical protein